MTENRARPALDGVIRRILGTFPSSLTLKKGVCKCLKVGGRSLCSGYSKKVSATDGGWAGRSGWMEGGQEVRVDGGWAGRSVWMEGGQEGQCGRRMGRRRL